MNKRLFAVIIPAILILVVGFIAVKIVSGAIHLLSGALNAVLGIAVIIALIVIVIWMFAYAKKNR